MRGILQECFRGSFDIMLPQQRFAYQKAPNAGFFKGHEVVVAAQTRFRNAQPVARYEVGQGMGSAEVPFEDRKIVPRASLE